MPETLKKMTLSRAYTLKPGTIVRNIEARSQLLVERGFDESGEPVLAFSHLTFQEYLVAAHFKGMTASRGEEMVSLQLLTLYEAQPEWWEEVALLYAAQLEGQERQSFYERMRTRSV